MKDEVLKRQPGTVNSETRISVLLKQHPGALDAIVSLSPRFEKLRNPVMRRLMAGRTSIAMATKLGGCRLEDFFQKLESLGFPIDRGSADTVRDNETERPGDLFDGVEPGQVTELDVRPVLASGRDPLRLILQTLETVEPGQVLRIINSFEPTPLVQLLQKQGYVSCTEWMGEELVHSYFRKPARDSGESPVADPGAHDDWDTVLARFEGRLEEVDVRNLEMPQPMHRILEALEGLPGGLALFVRHKRVPVFLLPELKERGFDYRIRELETGGVQLLIFEN